VADVPRIDANAFRDGVLHFNGELEALLASFGYPPAFGSPAAKEHLAVRDVDAVVGVIGQTQLLQESAADHVVALLRTLDEPIQSIAPFTCLRAAIRLHKSREA